jgi:hypothetical protein
MTVLHIIGTYFWTQLLGKYTSAELAPDPDVVKIRIPNTARKNATGS